LPDEVFEEAERVSKRLGIPRSRLYSKAVEEFVKRHRGKSVGESLEAVYADEPSDLDPLLVDLQAHALKEEW
jgi:metal-responsive CopG/Arc/MetJ family transcriptional regulator